MKKRITSVQRARQSVMRVNTLQTVSAYERKMGVKRTASVSKALRDLQARDVPPALWADEVEYTEPWMLPLLTDLYRTAGMQGAVEAAHRLLARKADPTDVFARAILQWAQDHLGERISLMTNTVNKWLRQTLTAIYMEHSDEGAEALTRRLYGETMQQYSGINKWQVRRICHTEAMHSLNIGGNVAADALGIPYEKTWSIAGINTRPTHQEVDGVTIQQGEMFSVGGFPMEYPMDERFGAPASEVINCSCAVIYLPRGNGITEI